MRRTLSHRNSLALPFLAFAVVVLVGGLFNSVDARGKVIDDSTGQPLADVSVSYGANRAVTSGTDGTYEIRGLPRGARLKTRMPGYLPQTPEAGANDIRLVPGSLTVQVNVEGSNPPKGVPKPEFRFNNKLLTTGNESGNTVITIVGEVPIGSKILVCAPGFLSKEFEARGVTLVTTLSTAPEGQGGCPPLP